MVKRLVLKKAEQTYQLQDYEGFLLVSGDIVIFTENYETLIFFDIDDPAKLKPDVKHIPQDIFFIDVDYTISEIESFLGIDIDRPIKSFKFTIEEED